MLHFQTERLSEYSVNMLEEAESCSLNFVVWRVNMKFSCWMHFRLFLINYHFRRSHSPVLFTVKSFQYCPPKFPINHVVSHWTSWLHFLLWRISEKLSLKKCLAIFSVWVPKVFKMFVPDSKSKLNLVNSSVRKFQRNEQKFWIKFYSRLLIQKIKNKKFRFKSLDSKLQKGSFLKVSNLEIFWG